LQKGFRVFPAFLARCSVKSRVSQQGEPAAQNNSHSLLPELISGALKLPPTCYVKTRHSEVQIVGTWWLYQDTGDAPDLLWDARHLHNSRLRNSYLEVTVYYDSSGKSVSCGFIMVVTQNDI